MNKKSGDVVGDISLGTDAWNVADGFTKLKILRHLILLDRFDTIAQFGTEDIGEDQMMDLNMINRRRVEGLERLHSALKQLLENTKFAIKKQDRKEAKLFRDRIKGLEEFLAKAYESSTDLVTKDAHFEINEKLFKNILEIMQEIKMEYNVTLNNANLIFRASEEVDLDKIMNDIIEGG